MPFDRFLVNHSVIAGARIPLKFLNKNSCFSGLNCTKVISSSEDTQNQSKESKLCQNRGNKFHLEKKKYRWPITSTVQGAIEDSVRRCEHENEADKDEFSSTGIPYFVVSQKSFLELKFKLFKS